MEAPARGQGSGRRAGDSEHLGDYLREDGVDRPDRVKTDGRRIVTVSRDVLYVVDAASRRLTGTLRLGTGETSAELMLTGDRALVLTYTPYRNERESTPSPDTLVGVRLVLVDVSGAPRVISRYTMEGDYVGARQRGSVAHVAVKSDARIPFSLPRGDRADANTEDQLLTANQNLIDKASVEQWLPRFEAESDGRTVRGAIDCGAVSRPRNHPGSTVVTLLTFDLARPTLNNGDPVGVATYVNEANWLQAHGASLYLATDNLWRAWRHTNHNRTAPVNLAMELYKFDMAATGRPSFRASGTVPGSLSTTYPLLSEWDGHVRIATTAEDTSFGVDGETSVSVLRQHKDSLVTVGKLGLGKDRRIDRVQFVGPMGYAMPYNANEPVDAVDLRQPAQPRIVGNFTFDWERGYLHGTGDRRLIGIGQTPDSKHPNEVTRITLYDTGDPARPHQIAHHVVPGRTTAAVPLYRPSTGLLVMPMSLGFRPAGALALKVSDRSITPLGQLSRPQGDILRALVIGDVLWTLSQDGMAAFDATSLNPLADIGLG